MNKENDYLKISSSDSVLARNFFIASIIGIIAFVASLFLIRDENDFPIILLATLILFLTITILLISRYLSSLEKIEIGDKKIVMKRLLEKETKSILWKNMQKITVVHVRKNFDVFARSEEEYLRFPGFYPRKKKIKELKKFLKKKSEEKGVDFITVDLHE